MIPNVVRLHVSTFESLEDNNADILQRIYIKWVQHITVFKQLNPNIDLLRTDIIPFANALKRET